jgi:hypothetical protein
MMKQVIFAVLVLPSAVIAAGLTETHPVRNLSVNGSSTGLCARIGVQSPAGPAMLRRDVRFQLCTPEGTPLNRQLNLELAIEPLTPGFSQGILGIQGVSTDAEGRFSFSYGGNSASQQAVTQELHTFLLDGKVIASFVLERGPNGLLFGRAPESLTRRNGDGEAEARLLLRKPVH